MENSLILCGGTGAHAAAAFLRLHILGSPLGFFQHEGKPLDFPNLYLVDQDSKDAAGNTPTAWQFTRSLLTAHPARHDWRKFIGRAAPPEMVQATPLPVGPEKNWSDRPHNSLRTRFESSPNLHLIASDYQKDIDYQKGMMGSPAMGSLLFRLKEHDESSRGLNHDLMYGQILDLRGRVVVAGSGVGGTGASVGPTLAERLVSRSAADVMAVMILGWFEFDEEAGSDEIQAKAQRRNRLMKENANSALEYYGRNLAQAVAAVPVGMPEGSLVKRVFTGDVGQPITESFIHAVAALCGYRHFCNPQPYSPGLYMMGAVERGRLDGRTDIPGGTLQSLANQAVTVADLAETWCRVLSSDQSGRVQPAIYSAVGAVSSSPRQVAEHLQHEVEHYREQLQWLKDTLGIEATPHRALTTEVRSRQRLAERQGLPVAPDAAPDTIAGALFHWTAEWVRDESRPENGLVITPAPVGGGQWPDLHNPNASGVAAERNGDLNRISDADAVLEAFVDPTRISVNGWPHPVAAADYFRFAIQRRDEVALRQLEMLLLGVVTGVLEIRPTMEREAALVSLESLVAEYRREGWDDLFAFEIIYPEREGRAIGFNSPHTLLAPVPFLSDEDETWLWDGLWKQLSGVKDGAFWTEAAKEPWDWGDTVQVRQIRAWIEKEKARRTGTAPGWTRVFRSVKVDPTQVPYGVGTPLQVYWGAPGDTTRSLVRLSLPTTESDEWTPPADTPVVEAEDLLEQIPNLLSVSDGSGRRFEHVAFRPPGDRTVRGWWREHLDQLRKEGQIHVWSWDKDRTITLGWMEGENLRAVRIRNSRLLDMSEVKIPSMIPLVQDPVPGSALRAGIKYPDLPLKVEYLDLLQTVGGQHWLKEAAAGTIKVNEGLGRPVERAGVVGGSAVSWKLRLRGRSDEVPVELAVEPDDQPVRAHWLVWPSFRAPREAGWKSYYLYEYTELVDASLDVVWVQEEDESEVRLLSMPRRRGGHDLKAAACPIDFEKESGGGARKGGPPLAVTLKLRGSREAGVYLVPLQKVGIYSAELYLGIDFGTSHSSAAVSKSPSSLPEPVSLAPELALSPNKKALTLAISESWKRISESPAGIFGQHGWMPTYRSTGGGFLPSELLLSNTLENVQAQDVREWIPGLDYMIPPTDMGRDDLSKHLLTDFKWDAGSVHFHGREGQLREHYLSLLLELVLADVVVNHTNGVPTGDVSTTFTYPLRAKDQQVEALQKSFEGALERAKASTGINLRMFNGIGIFDESRAARVSSNLEGEVTLVADLGGGTLDVFVMAAEAGKIRFPEVADSARIGGNLLLRQIAEVPNGILPADGNWRTDGTRDTETKLRAWMRTLGAPRLFGVDAGDSPALEGMKVTGFRGAADGDRARRLIDRYFRLLTEYLARYLAGYLYKHWYPKATKETWSRLKLAVQLRGNGWKLNYRKESHEETTRGIQDAIRERVKGLWNLLPEHPYPNPYDAEWADPSMHAQEDPKTVTVKGVVGRAMSYEEVKDRWNSQTLVDVDVLHDAGDRSTFGWYESIPLNTRSSKQVEVRTIQPPVVVSSPFEDHEVAIEELDMASHGVVQAKLKDTESRVDPGRGTYTAPVAPILWEAMFDSKAFWPER